MFVSGCEPANRTETPASEDLYDQSAQAGVERRVCEREGALRAEVSAGAIEVRQDDQSAKQRARVSITDRGDIVISIRRDLARSSFHEVRGNVGLAATVANQVTCYQIKVAAQKSRPVWQVGSGGLSGVPAMIGEAPLVIFFLHNSDSSSASALC